MLRHTTLVLAAPAHRACATSTLSSSAWQTFPSGLWPAGKDCFGLHGHSAFGSVANNESGVGRKSATSVGLTTDLVHWLQAGKTVAVVRFASESTDLLPPSALLRQQARLLPGFSTPGLRPPPFRGILLPPAAVACSFSRPPALRRADYRCQSADADLPPVRFPNPFRLRRHPLTGELPASRPVAPVIVLPLWIVIILLVVIGMLDETNRSASAYVVNSVLMVLLSLA